MARNIYNRLASKNWSDLSKFRILFSGPGTKCLGLESIQEDLQYCIVDVGLSGLSGDTLENWAAEEWHHAQGRISSKDITITFRDYDKFSLYRKFSHCFKHWQRDYPSQQYLRITVQTADDININDYKDFYTFKDCLITSISGLDFGQDKVEDVPTFSVTFKSPYVRVH